MSQQKETRSLKEIARLLDEDGIPWAVFAGAAAVAYGSPRPLTDVDILVPRAEGDRVAAMFPEARHIRHGEIQVVALPGVDIVAGLHDVDLDEEMAARRTRHEILGVAVPVIPPEDNILVKALRGRGPEEGKHDWEDVGAMMAHLPALDWAYLRWRASWCGPQDHVERVLARLEALWRGRDRA